MALAVASTSSASVDQASTLVVSAPTGIETGDLLLIVATPLVDSASNRANISCSGFTAQENLFTNQVPGDISVQILSKIADSVDEVATNYTLNVSAQAMGVAAILRITGWQTSNATLSPIVETSTQAVRSSGSSVNFSQAGLGMRRNDSTLVLMFGSVVSDPHTLSISSPTVTSGAANPTWTTVVEDSCVNSGNTEENSFFLLYANTTDTSDVTGWAIDVSETGMSDVGTWLAGVATILEPSPATGDISHQQISPGLEELTATQVTVSPEVGHVDSEVEAYGAETVATAPTQWTEETKESTTWTEESL